jgi:hypothetical protein
MNVIVEHDTFDIVLRLKQIDPNYLIVRNTTKHRFELHYKANGSSRLEAVIPFRELDSRTLEYVNTTRVENQKTLLEQMEKHNQKLQQSQTQKVVDEMQTKAKEITKYVFQKGEHTPYVSETSYQTKWV